METDDFFEDNLGWVDDFRALPGECGQPITQILYAQSLINQGVSFRQLKQMGFSKDLIAGVTKHMVAEEYNDIKVGTLVTSSHHHLTDAFKSYTGVVTHVERRQVMFSDKYSILETETLIHVLCEGEIKIFTLEEDRVDLVNEYI